MKKIAYYSEGKEKGKVIYLPISSMKLTDSQEKIMISIKSNKIASYKTIADATGLSTRAVDELITRYFKKIITWRD